MVVVTALVGSRSDVLFPDGQRDRGPTMAFLRCDQGSRAVDHHTLPSGGHGFTGTADRAARLYTA